MAYYGEHVRCNLLGVENCFQVSRDDLQTCYDAQHYCFAHERNAGPIMFRSPEYGWACFRMYRWVIGHTLYPAVVVFPSFYLDCFRACCLEALPVHGDYYPPRPSPPAWLPEWGCAALQWLTHYAFWFFVVGALVSVLTGSEPLPAVSLLLFSVYHAAVLFAVLPEHKHAGAMVLSLSVFSAIGAWALTRLVASPSSWRTAWSTLRPRLPITGITVLLLVLGWGMSCACTRWYSTWLREACLRDIQALHGTPAPEAVKNQAFFSVRIPADPSHSPTGYLLQVRAGKNPARVLCRSIRLPHPRVDARMLETWHDLHSEREQFFFVTCFQGARHGDPRPLICTVAIQGDAEILGCQQLDLTDWKHGPMSTVFYPGQRTPGNPPVLGVSTKTHYALPGVVNCHGLSVEECIASPSLDPPSP
jgi:hypothetical protein